MSVKLAKAELVGISMTISDSTESLSLSLPLILWVFGFLILIAFPTNLDLNHFHTINVDHTNLRTNSH
jgi:hypothetical protein